MSHVMSSSNILTAWGKGTLLESNLIKSRAFRMAAGSHVFLVVFTVILPSTKSNTQAIPCTLVDLNHDDEVITRTCFSRAFVTSDQLSRRYCSLYLGKRVAKDDSSVNGVLLSSLVKGSIFHCNKEVSFLHTVRIGEGDTWSMSSVSHGLGFL